MDLRNRRGVVTGAGSGIGRAVAVELGRLGGELLLVGRREDKLQETAELVTAEGGQAHVLAADLTDPAAVEAVTAATLALGQVDLLVNNAGTVRAGWLADHEVQDVHTMIALNLTAPILLTRALLPALRAAAAVNGGLILNISSGVALIGLPCYSVYAATKAGLARFGESLRRELPGTGLHLATVYPGATDTDMMATSEAGPEHGFAKRSVREVVAEIISALANGEHEINTSLPERQEIQRRNAVDPLAVDALLAPRLAGFEQAVRDHRTT
ncbi:SDR family NAD(P)-dependent oxidoreductase [Crossiella sp. NPDC003009]